MSAQSVNISKVVEQFGHHAGVGQLAAAFARRDVQQISVSGLAGSGLAVVFAAFYRQVRPVAPVVFVMNDEDEAGYLFQDLKQMVGDAVAFYPSSYRRAIKYAHLDEANQMLRTQVQHRLAQGEKGLLLVTYADALCELVPSLSVVAQSRLTLRAGQALQMRALIDKLSEWGFKTVDYVYNPGEMAVRGSLVDVFSYASDNPVRIDFFGDEIDSVRYFEVETQLSKKKSDEISIFPRSSVESRENVPFTQCWPAETLLVSHNLSFVCERVGQVYDEGFVEQAAIERESEHTDDLQARASVLVRPEVFTASVSAFRRINLSRQAGPRAGISVAFGQHAQPLFHKKMDLLAQTLGSYRTQGYEVCILADSAKQQERLREIFAGLAADVPFVAVEPTLHEGFVDDDLRLVCFTDHQIFDRFHKYSLQTEHVRGGKLALTLKELNELEIGDYVVHIDYGIGRFAGLVRIPNGQGGMQEVIKLVYQNNELLFVSIHSLYKISKYKGREGEPPRLSRLGTGAWEKLKNRTKNKIKDIARDLIKLYSARQHERGFAFSPDNFMQQELEAGFAYEDTPDQLKVTQQVKADMERPRPMDRLVCGDVGFGKTEIAVRAAFKAACDNKQVAVLVPTTVLALQHYRTFSARLKNFPVRVDYLSRARTAAQTKQILADLAAGRIDILIGTHKLIGRGVKFKDLGLLIIDEEQKFGVSVKERLRQIKTNVDTLTMTATPIPRTLQFSLMGARDFSVLQTPPPNRYPIYTELQPFNHQVIADAVGYEMSRGGQVFIVSNRISALPNLAGIVRKYVRGARVAIGHGQMPPEELEKIVTGFINYDYDVLVSTTVIENGIDIPNANTMIIDAAQQFGLSDLHQMRGRVGRGHRKAFCYLLTPPLSMLPDDARRRLEAIENFSDLGAGIHIAMQDLDIRGAGNLLGSEQSGFIADLGYETYQKILAEAVTELKTQEFADVYNEELAAPDVSGEQFVTSCSLDSDLPMSFSENYVPTAEERITLYRELDNLSTDEELEAFRARMTDRFGPIPPESDELMNVVPLRRLGRKLGVEHIVLKRGRMSLYFVADAASPFYKSATFGCLIDYATQHFSTCQIGEASGKRRMLITGVGSVRQALDILRRIAATLPQK